jgi:hypothetical protein
MILPKTWRGDLAANSGGAIFPNLASGQSGETALDRLAGYIHLGAWCDNISPWIAWSQPCWPGRC